MKDDRRLLPETSVAIDLSRRKRQANAEPPRRGIAAAAQERIAPYTSMVRIALEQLQRSHMARAGALVVACLTMIAIFADVLASELPIVCRVRGVVYVLPNVSKPAALRGFDQARLARESDAGDWTIPTLLRHGPNPVVPPPPGEELRAPSFTSGHLLGTDARGRDVLARVIHGTRTALTAGLIAVIAFAGIGIFMGALAGFFGGMLDAVVARVIEIVTAFPTLVLVLVVQAVVPHPTTYTMLLAIGLTRWTEVARLVRAEVLLVGAQDYVTAARALGASSWRVLRRHVLPNAVAPAMVAATFGVATVVLIEASLDFLRVGVPSQVASWGETLSESREHSGAWWLLVFPGGMVFLTVVALNLVGEALRDALDPRLRDAVRIVESAQEKHAGPISKGTGMPPSSAAFDESAHT